LTRVRAFATVRKTYGTNWMGRASGFALSQRLWRASPSQTRAVRAGLARVTSKRAEPRTAIPSSSRRIGRAGRSGRWYESSRSRDVGWRVLTEPRRGTRSRPPDAPRRKVHCAIDRVRQFDSRSTERARPTEIVTRAGTRTHLTARETATKRVGRAIRTVATSERRDTRAHQNESAMRSLWRRR
jgi:hypothetical protein